MYNTKLANKTKELGGAKGPAHWRSVGGGPPRGAPANTPEWNTYKGELADEVATQIMEHAEKTALADVGAANIGIIFATGGGPMGGTMAKLIAEKTGGKFIGALPQMTPGIDDTNTQFEDYLTTKIELDHNAGWTEIVNVATLGIMHNNVDFARDADKCTFVIVGSEKGRAGILTTPESGETREAKRALLSKLPCVGAERIVNELQKAGALHTFVNRMHQAALKPRTVEFLKGNPSKKVATARVLSALQSMNTSGELTTMADCSEKMNPLDRKDFMMTTVWPRLRNILATKHLLATDKGDEFEWKEEDAAGGFAFLGSHGKEKAEVGFSLGKMRAPEGASPQITIASACLFAIRFSAPADGPEAFLNTGLFKNASPEELFKDPDHAVRVLRNAVEMIRAMVSPFENMEKSAEFKAIVGLSPAAWITIAIQLHDRLVAYDEFAKADKRKGGRKKTKGEKTTQLRKLLKQTRTTLSMGTFQMTPAAEKEEQATLRELKRDFDAQRRTDAIVQALEQRKAPYQGGGGGGDGKHTKRQKTQRVKLCRNCGVDGHLGSDCKARSLLSSGEPMSYRQLAYIEATPGFDIKVQHATIPEARRPARPG